MNFWLNDSLNTDKALDFCLTAWSLADWDFYFKNPDLVAKKEDHAAREKKKAYRKDVFQLCEHLRIVHDIANGTKHFSLTRAISGDISNVYLETHSGFTSGFPWGNGPKAVIDNRRHNLGSIIKNVHQFWNGYLQKRD